MSLYAATLTTVRDYGGPGGAMRDTELFEQSDSTGEVVTGLTLDRLGAVRDLATDLARDFGMSPSAVVDAVIAINEITTNAVTHGRTPARVRMWREAGELVVEVIDSGCWTRSAAGADLPDDASPDGRGLWIARAVANAVTVRSDDHGTCVTLRFALA